MFSEVLSHVITGEIAPEETSRGPADVATLQALMNELTEMRVSPATASTQEYYLQHKDRVCM